MRNQRVRRLCITGIYCAVIFLFTGYFHIPSYTGYTHVGDGFLYLAACMLPLPCAAFAGAAGAVLADCMTGFAIWAPGTAIIKAVTVLFFSRRAKKLITLHNLLALLPAAAVCIGGYYLYDALITGNFLAPLSGIPGYITQSLFSSLLFVLAGAALDKCGGRTLLSHGGMNI